MITTDNIKNIFNKYATLAADADVVTERNLHSLMMYALDAPGIDFDGDALVFAAAPAPFDRIEIERILGAEDMGSHMAVVLPAAVLFVDKRTGDVRVALPE